MEDEPVMLSNFYLMQSEPHQQLITNDFLFSFSYWYFIISFLKKICALFVCNSRFIYLGETFSPLQLVGAVVTLVAIYMVNYRNVVEWSMPMINMGWFKIWMKGMQCLSECCGMKDQYGLSCWHLNERKEMLVWRLPLDPHDLVWRCL